MGVRVGLMGFGRIGRNVFRIIYPREDVEVVAIVDIAEPKSLEFVRVEDLLMGARGGAGNKSMPQVIHDVKQGVSVQVAHESMEKIKQRAREILTEMRQELGRLPTANELIKRMGKDSGLSKDMASALVTENGASP